MFFMKHGLITLTILSVVIWVTPVTSDNLNVLRAACEEILKDFTTFQVQIFNTEQLKTEIANIEHLMNFQFPVGHKKIMKKIRDSFVADLTEKEFITKFCERSIQYINDPEQNVFYKILLEAIPVNIELQL